MPDLLPDHLDHAAVGGLSPATRLLVVETAAGDAAHVAALLADSGRPVEVRAVARPCDAAQEIAEAPVDVVVVAQPIDGPAGMLLPLVRELADVLPHVPAVIIGGADEVGALEAIRAGAQDVLHRDGLTAAGLARALSFAIERDRAGTELARQAMHDPLTGLPNRILLGDRLQQALGRLGRHDDAVAVLLIDLDGFKGINDTLGHARGDQLLVEVARRLEAVLRTGDTAARVGGDEFVVLCEGIRGEHQAVAVAQRVGASLGEPFMLAGGERHISSSIGIALARVPGASAQDLVRDADAAMYRAKRRAAPYEVFDDEMRVRAKHRIDLEDELRRGIAEGEFALHYQPVFRLTTGAICGVEALLRWVHPGRGVVGPADFLDVAEDAGLMLPIGAWSIASAARQSALWALDRPGGMPVTVSVNLSPRQCLSHETVTAVQDALRQSGADPQTLCLEFTEAAVIADLGRAGRVLRGLKDLGVRLAIDDFGTAQSSLRLLEQLPADQVKIDRSFIVGMAQSDEEAAIVAAVIGLAHAFGLTTIAEGVEELRQVDRLRALGCDAAQGHYFAAAQPAGELDGLLRSLA